MQAVPKFTYNHTTDMPEISGFGGSYEETCQNMLDAGVHWILANKDADVTIRTAEGVTGLIMFESEKAKELEKVLLEACNNDCTGAMMQTVVERLAYINTHGWEQYCEELRKPNPEPKVEYERTGEQLDELDLVTTLQSVFGADRVMIISSPEDLDRLFGDLGDEEEKN